MADVTARLRAKKRIPQAVNNIWEERDKHIIKESRERREGGGA
jgi:hypothetical protein